MLRKLFRCRDLAIVSWFRFIASDNYLFSHIYPPPAMKFLSNIPAILFVAMTPCDFAN
jgi:hypothetical protein